MAYRDRSWLPPAHPLADRRRNVSDAERWASAAIGAALVTWALRRRSHDAWALGALGAALLYRAGTGTCPVYAATGISTAEDTSTKRALSGPRGVIVESAVTIDKPARELFAFWRNLENLPRVMQHVESVTPLGGRSRWVARAPLGTTVEWEAEIINEVPDRVIGWRSLEGSTIATAGSVRFEELADGRSTTVRVKLQYEPPAGRLGAWVAWALGEEPSIQVREDLQRFKQLMEADGREID